jgi:hypothetical protein
VKYPVPATAGGYALRRARIAATLSISDVRRFLLDHWGLLAALAFTFIVHAPTLRYYFDGDDFVVLGSVEYLGGRHYIADTFFMRDIVPNWRPLTGVIYAAEWKMFGLNAMAWRSVNLSIHLASMCVLYALVLRVTKRPAIGAIAAIIFGVSGAHFDTVTYITALPHVLATFLTLSSLLALLSYAQDGERDWRAYWLSFGLFGLAFLSNEGAFVYAPVLVAAYTLFARRWHDAPLRLPLHAAPFVALAAGWLAFYQACTCQQLKFDGFFWDTHVIRNYTVYLSWLVYPAHAIPVEPGVLRSVLASIVVAGAVFFAIRGPNIARVCVLGIALALLPFVPVRIWTASRYTYAAVAFFSPIAAIALYYLYDRVARMHRHIRIPAMALGLALVSAIAVLYSWQTLAQDTRSGRNTDRWLLLVNELQGNYQDVPDGTTIYIVDGPWTNPMEQYTWVPSVARAVYGDAAAFNLPREQYAADPPDTRNTLFLEWIPGEGLRPVSPQQVITPER